MKKTLIISAILFSSIVKAQIPVEVFGGHKRTTVDIMFFKFFKHKEQNTKFLFFNRNRAAVDYSITTKSNLPQFGFTEAISYNHPKLKGFAPVIVGQVLSWGVFPKAGIQYAHISKHLTVFSWIVSETLKDPDLDFFFLIRFTPKLSEKLELFTQAEVINAFPIDGKSNYSFTQRARLGLKYHEWQFGAGADFIEIGNKTYTVTNNIGVFLRHEF